MFEKAKPIWLTGRETELHLTVQYKAVVESASSAVVRIATSGLYHLTVNGVFVCYGPARAGRHHFRMDEIDISSRLTRSENVVVVEVCGYNSDGFCILNQPSFLQAEVVNNETVLAATGTDFTARVHPFLYRKTQRYSFQRPQTEAYHIDWIDTWLTDTVPGTEPLSETPAKTIIPRGVPYPLFEEEGAQPLYSGTVEHIEPAEYKRDRSWVYTGPGYPTAIPIPKLEVFPTDEYQRMCFVPGNTCIGGELAADTYTVYSLTHNATGMLNCRVACPAPLQLYFMFDEILSDGAVDALRMDCANVIRYDLCAGVHDLQFFEVYTMKYLQVVAIDGACTVENLRMVEYKHPPVTVPFAPTNAALRKITDAAVETFRQNAVDLFTDCPSRERAGWLCDSFWTGRVEYLLTGDTKVETNFLENFLHQERDPRLPKDIFPMCYPAEHVEGGYIPQWAMWLVLELREYRDRNGDPALIERYRPRIEKLLKFFAAYENEDGLLESLESWNFIEWSKANELTQDVNYPTNMLYTGMLRAAADLYGDTSLIQKADRIKDIILKQAFDGQFFVDNALRRDGKLILSGERTEVCQYYAFFFEVATPETHGELLECLVRDFGPYRGQTGKWPEIWPANAFIGNYLRLDMLLRLGYRQEVLENIEGYFLYMAERTGTLWENVGTTASCNHGFSSHVLCWLDKLLK